jgi:hypothetical protein
MARGDYSLWQYDNTGYAELVQVTGTLAANRDDIGSESLLLLETLGGGQDWAVSWPGRPAPRTPTGPPIPVGESLPRPGVVENVRTDLGDGDLSADVTMAKAGALLFSVAYDPGWHAWVDGRPTSTQMLAPALVGVKLGPGRHHVVLRYVGFGWYPELWLEGFLVLVALCALGRRWYQLDHRSGPGAAGPQQ